MTSLPPYGSPAGLGRGGAMGGSVPHSYASPFNVPGGGAGMPSNTPAQFYQRSAPGPMPSGLAASPVPAPAPSAMMPKRPAETAPSGKPKRKRPADRVLPKKIEAYIPESRLYTQLQEVEKKLDATISRKKLDMMEQKNQLKPSKRTLRIFLSNLSSDQYVEMNPLSENEDVFSLESMRAPSWTLRIEGRLLDLPNSRKPQANPPKFSTFVRSVIVELQRDKDLYPEGNIIEWHRGEGSPDCDGFEIKRKGDSDVNAKILIYLDHKPEKVKLSTSLSKLLDIHTDTPTNVIMALWQYVKSQKLQDPDDKRFINCDEQLRQILGQPRITFAHMPELLRAHFAPPDPIVLEYTVRTDKEQNVSQFAYDVEVEVPNPMRERLEQTLVSNPQLQRDIGQLDDKITTLIQTINHCKLKRDFMLSFANDPIGFLNQWMASQSRDLEVILGDTRFNLEETRRATFFDHSVVQEAVFHHLRQKDIE
ncbi:uncharacterized protein SPPG_02282 [Spizellomyces punctatus DAOM BR117]|uniref:DM2 domain-containing protein n=1 Tax=Spizellomyces punctatus (strain DAOM BR117) TaxID=645134 RepID=A0A0L0HQ95_SPIPD|nr:uncharacterized protein SPPG_02282 [Spizellomyces punctatus DAOM BR117]KND03228.1 hypothetical protein SPPG_02282 [Spizellomyces punctatus DAOM BR117]|eukprot:XP_016611267.1 hypothetical protein SPPG_02282 [Spizellomyces punctatus DAOM BR117]